MTLVNAVFGRISFHPLKIKWEFIDLFLNNNCLTYQKWPKKALSSSKLQFLHYFFNYNIFTVIYIYIHTKKHTEHLFTVADRNS